MKNNVSFKIFKICTICRKKKIIMKTSNKFILNTRRSEADALTNCQSYNDVVEIIFIVYIEREYLI